MTEYQSELDAIRSRLIERANSDPGTHPYMKNEFDIAYNSGDLELLRAFDALFVPGSTMGTINEYVAQLRHTGLNMPLDQYFTHEHMKAFQMTGFALQVASGSRVFNHMLGFEVFESHLPSLPVLRAALETPERYEQLVSLIKARGIDDPDTILELHREMLSKPRPLSEGTL